MGHIRMMAAVQPFLSGAISKTVNMPHETTVEEIERVYLEGWRLGLKAVAIYRDGSKRTQPVNVGRHGDRAEDVETFSLEQLEAARRAPHRTRLPATRPSITHKFEVGGHEGYLNVGLYENSTPGELFITMAKEGSTVGGMMDAFATAISLCLQYGVPLDALVKKFSHQRFEPSGMTSNKDIPFAKSVVDYIFRWLGVSFLDDYRKTNVPQRASTIARADQKAAAPEAVTEGDPSDTDGADGASHTDVNRSVGALRRQGAYVASPGGGNGDRQGGGNGQGSAGGNGDGAVRRTPAAVDRRQQPAAYERVDQQFSHYQEDAPACDVCGAITVRNGNCYKCYNCGSTLGCS